eukprot:EC824415.1.p1 GENE.EC824415.1~~EC824415.1.p1  ORF type:complete len:108 (+),score=56.65 EC824415.1:19-342(+)
MKNGVPIIPKISNEPLLNYEEGSKDRSDLLKECENLKKNITEVPVVINGVEYKTGEFQEYCMPGDNKQKLYRIYGATPELLKKAVDGALDAKKNGKNYHMNIEFQYF